MLAFISLGPWQQGDPWTLSPPTHSLALLILSQSLLPPLSSSTMTSLLSSRYDPQSLTLNLDLCSKCQSQMSHCPEYLHLEISGAHHGTFRTVPSGSLHLDNWVMVVWLRNLSLTLDSAPPSLHHPLKKRASAFLLHATQTHPLPSIHTITHYHSWSHHPVTLSTARASMAGLSHWGGEGDQGPIHGLGHVHPQGEARHLSKCHPVPPWAFSLETLQTLSLFCPGDQMWMQLLSLWGKFSNLLIIITLPQTEFSIPWRPDHKITKTQKYL